MSPVLRRLPGWVRPHPVHLIALIVRFDLLVLEAVVPLALSVAEVVWIVVHDSAGYAPTEPVGTGSSPLPESPESTGRYARGMVDVPLARHLLRAKDLVDARYFEPLAVADLAAVAGLSPAYFSRELRRTFGESPHQYLLTRRLERAASLLRHTDRSVTEICL